MSTTLYHMNPKTERVGVCRATPEGRCPFGAVDPHFTTKEDCQTYYERQLENELGIFGTPSVALTRDAVARRLNILPDEVLETLITRRMRRGGYTSAEIERARENGEPFYVHYTTNQEITLELEDTRTQHTFMRGACTLFAAELHKATGYPMVVFTDESFGGTWQGHVALALPDGTFLDASGRSSNPTDGYANGHTWRRDEVTTRDALIEHVSHRDEAGNVFPEPELPMLERFALARLAFDALASEGVLED